MENQEPRRSERTTKGLRRTRFGSETPTDATTKTGEAVRGHSPALSSASGRSNSSTARAELLRVELQTAEKVAAMEQTAREEKLEADKRLAELRLAAQQAEIIARDSDANDEYEDSEDTQPPPPLGVEQGERSPYEYARVHASPDVDALSESGARLRSLEHAVARASNSGSHASTDNAAHGGALVYVDGARDAIETFDMGSHSTNLPNHALTAVDSSADSHESFAQGRIQQLEQELAHVQQEVVTIDRIYQEKLKTEVSCKAKLSQALASVQDEVRALREETNSLQQDLESAEEHANSLQQTNVQLAQQLTNARAQQREHEKASRNHAEQARRQQQRADELAAARQEQEDALDDATQELRDTKNRLAASEQQRRPLADTGSARDVVASAVTQLAHVLTDRMPVTAAATRTADCSTNRVDSLTKIVARQSSAKDLPTFSGDPTAWPMFIHAFRGSTTECEFSNQENSARLLKALKGKALDTVKAMLVIPDNLERVIRTLQMRYGQPDQVVQAMIDGVKQLRVLRDDDFEQLIDLSNAVGNLVATMHLMDHIGHLTNPQLRQEVVHRLPSSLQRQWGETIAKKEQRDINLQTLADWLAERADAVCCIRKITAKPAETTQKHTPSHRRPFGTREAVYTTSSQPAQDQCGFCKKPGHATTVCRTLGRKPPEERWKWVKTERRCFICLLQGHRVGECPRKKPCNKNGCDRLHHPLLHPTQTDTVSTPAAAGEHTLLARKKPPLRSRVTLRTVPVTISGPAGNVHTSALLDEASTVTLLEADLAREIGATGPCIPLTLTWTNQSSQSDEQSMRVQVKIQGDGEEFIMDGVRTVQQLDLPTQHIDLKAAQDSWSHLAVADAHLSVCEKPRLLIGQDNVGLTIPRKVVEGPPGSPTLSKCKLGWSIHGMNCNQKLPTSLSNASTALMQNSDETDLHQLVKDSFRTDSFGVKIISTKVRSREEDRAEKLLKSTTRRVGDRWETGLLWRTPDITLPESKTMATSRLKSLERKMDRNPAFSEAYSRKIEQYIEDGYARKLSADELAQETTREWYLPHFGVTNPNKPGKLRLVFDAAARSNGTSLNDALMPGPDLLNPLTSVLFKFRQHRVAYAGDIRQMFHQVRIRAADQPAQRFLWRGTDRQRKPDVFQMEAMTFGAVCSPASAQHVMRRNAEDFAERYPDAVRAVNDNHYMDDYLDSSPSEKQATEKAHQIIEIHNAGGFEIRSWTSNSRHVLDQIPLELRSAKALNFDSGTDHQVDRALGLKWNPQEDVFSFALSQNLIQEEASTPKPTKRQALRMIMSVFDPLGFLACHTLAARVLLQDVWRTGITWDEQLPEKLLERWRLWWDGLNDLSMLTVPRCYCLSMADRTSLELHVFGDASEKAFAAAAYLRVINKDFVKVCFAAGKVRVAPLKPISIPRLELQAALMASRLAETVRKEHELEISSTTLWTDSTTVLHWLRADARRFKPFVAHRIGEIDELSDLSQWRWVPTADNPADAATRVQASPMDSELTWLGGPKFLERPEHDWPVEREPSTESATPDIEMKTEFLGATTDKPQLALPDISRFSSWIRLARVTGWVVRYVRNLKAKISRKPLINGELRPNEFRRAQHLWWLKAQADTYSTEIVDLNTSSNVQKSSRLYTLSPILDEEGIIRLSGRIRTAPVGSPIVLDPVILPPDHALTRLLLQHFHTCCGHQGQSNMANMVRRKYWVPHLRAAVRRSWTNCQTCKINRARPIVPQMGALPDGRVAAFVRPFTHCGVDYFGPMEVTVGRRHEKRYGVLFTCLTTRAVHLELARDLTTDSAIMAIRRMIGRRGHPGTMYSDNGTNFRGAEKELRQALEAFDHDKIRGFLTPRGSDWSFNPPATPHMGGAWERLVRSVKTALKAVLTERAPREDTLTTLFAEVESLLNSRPLTHVSCDPTDEESLTPNHFLLGTPSCHQPPGKFDDSDLCLRKQWRIGQTLTDHFWRRWLKEYLPTLTRRTKWHQRQGKQVRVGDIVFIVDRDLPRGSWPRGKVVAVYPGADECIRVADVKTQSGTFRRPVAKICVLDVQDGDA